MYYKKKNKIKINGSSSQSYPFLLLKSPPLSRFIPLPLSPLLASICFLSLPCGPVMVVADEMRLHLKWAMQGGVCSDTDGSSSVVKALTLLQQKAPTLITSKLIYVCFLFNLSSHQLAWTCRQKAKVLTTEYNSKVNHSETSASSLIVLQLAAGPFDFFVKIERFFGSRPEAFKHIPSASESEKRHGRFFASPSCFASAAMLFLSLSLSQSEGPRPKVENTFQMQTPRSLSLLLSVISPVRFLFPPAGLLCVLCDVCPSPAGLYPLCAPKGPRACCCSLKRLGENFGATL